MELQPVISIHMFHFPLIHKIINLIPGTDKASDKSTPKLNPHLYKNGEVQEIDNYFNYRSMIGFIKLLTKYTQPEAQSAVQQYRRFRFDPKHNKTQAVKRMIKFLKGTDTKGLILKPVSTNGAKFYVEKNLLEDGTKTSEWNQDRYYCASDI